jgi:hypothetical protein
MQEKGIPDFSFVSEWQSEGNGPTEKKIELIRPFLFTVRHCCDTTMPAILKTFDIICFEHCNKKIFSLELPECCPGNLQLQSL